MSSLDCDIPFGDFFAEKKLLGTFLCAVMKKPSKTGPYLYTPVNHICIQFGLRGNGRQYVNYLVIV